MKQQAWGEYVARFMPATSSQRSPVGDVTGGGHTPPPAHPQAVGGGGDVSSGSRNSFSALSTESDVSVAPESSGVTDYAGHASRAVDLDNVSVEDVSELGLQ